MTGTAIAYAIVWTTLTLYLVRLMVVQRRLGRQQRRLEELDRSCRAENRPEGAKAA